MENYTVYGKDKCSYCENAKELLTKRDKDFTYLSLGDDYEVEDLIDLVFTTFGKKASSFPQIMLKTEIGTTYIGGFTELLTHLNK